MLFCALLLALALPAFHCAWVPLWADNFDGPALNESNWNVMSNVSEGRPPTWNQIELYTADNVYLSGGALVLRTRPQNVTFAGIHYNITSGRVDTAFKRNLTFGRVEVSAQLQNDAASGLHTAHWLLGYDCWPRGAEIDLMECQSPHNAYSSAGGGSWQVATSNYHFGPACGTEVHHTTGTSAWPRAPTPGLNYSAGYTQFAVEWNATDLVYFVGGQRVNHVWEGMPGWAGEFSIPSWPMYLILSQAYMAKRPYGNPEAWLWPVEQRIDYVRVYSWEP
jgi:beta-glucanase (GH16 family)